MTLAELHGKLKSHDNSEDLLTSDIFGGFSYTKPNNGLVPSLKQSENILGESFPLLKDIISIDYYFWIKTTYFKREPDVLCILKEKDGSIITLMVECKYTSPKSNRNVVETVISGGDQLTEQYYDLVKVNVDYDIKEKIKGSKKYLLYVTAHFGFPRSEIQDSIDNLEKLGITNSNESIYWISWRNIHSVLGDLLSNNELEKETTNLLSDMHRLLERKGLTPFDGFSHIQSINTGNITKPFFWTK